MNKVEQQKKVPNDQTVAAPQISLKTAVNVVKAVNRLSPKKDGNSPRKSLSPKKTK